MNIFDIIVYIALVGGIFNGWRRGFLLQMLSLLAVVAALFFAAQYGSELERIVGIDCAIPGVAGFIIIFIAMLLFISVGGLSEHHVKGKTAIRVMLVCKDVVDDY